MLNQKLPEDVFCALQFGGVPYDVDPRRIVLPLIPLGEPNDAGEIWYSDRRSQRGYKNDFGYVANGQVMMVQLQLPNTSRVAFEDGVCAVYRKLNSFVRNAGYPYLLRVWNYLSDINDGEGDAERYRRFCAGRYRALAVVEDFERQLPAASAIGSHDKGGLRLFALAARHPGLPVENPLQVSAYRYPRMYGQRSPSFVRGILVPWADGPQLFASGTASIVGHSTLYPGDAVAQMRQAVVNLETLREHAVRSYLPGHVPTRLQLESCLVYVRNAGDASALSRLVPDLFGRQPVRILVGDICRLDLLVEIEAVYRQMTRLAP